MNSEIRHAASRSFRGNINTRCKSSRLAVLIALLLAGVGSLALGAAPEAKAQSITLAQLAGQWQIALVGHTTTCGATSMLFNAPLNSSGTAQVIVTGGCELSGTQTFSITSLNSHGTGTAVLSCTPSCELGPIFNIQVDANKKTFELEALDAPTYILAGTAVKQVEESMTIAQLAGPWQISLAGNTGCGASSLEFTGTLSTSGTATGTLIGSSTGCPSSSSTQTFTITSLNTNGSGTANLSCGSGCGWDFNIQVDASKQLLNLVDVVNGGNGLAGTAVSQAGPASSVSQLVGSWQIALVGNTGCGQSDMQFNGVMNTSGAATGTLTGSSTGCTGSSSTQTFTIHSLNADGTGTASLSCGAGCGWNFNIQVSPNKQTFNLVDTGSGDPNFNELTGTAVAQGFTIVPDEAGNIPQAAEQDLQANGLRWRLSGLGNTVLTTRPAAGTSVPIGSTVTLVLFNEH